MENTILQFKLDFDFDFWPFDSNDRTFLRLLWISMQCQKKDSEIQDIFIGNLSQNLKQQWKSCCNIIEVGCNKHNEFFNAAMKLSL